MGAVRRPVPDSGRREQKAGSYVGDVGVYQLWAHLLDL